MNKPLQNFLLWLYRKLDQLGILNNRLARGLFYRFYDLYKLLFEAGPVEQLRPYAQPGTVVIDVGANVGFFTLRFAKWIANSGGKVIALEPETVNYQRLVKVLEGKGYTRDVVEALPCAVAENSGVMRLAINPYHPGDHRLDDNGIPVDVVTIDNLMAERGWPPVSLIKIDVQGAEMRVVQGAVSCLEKSKPTLFIEVDDENLKNNGSSAEELIGKLGTLGYKPFQLRKNARPKEITGDEALALVSAHQYADFLFVRASEG